MQHSGINQTPEDSKMPASNPMISMPVNGVEESPAMPVNNAEGAQQFCLRWNSYPATVATQLAALRAAEDFVDVTLACDGRQLRAHKLVLSACSPYFMQLFKSTPCKHPVIFLKDVGFRQLVALLEFMYAGEVNVSQAELPALLRTAEALQVRGLADTNPNSSFPSPPKPQFPEPEPQTQAQQQQPQPPQFYNGVNGKEKEDPPFVEDESQVETECDSLQQFEEGQVFPNADPGFDISDDLGGDLLPGEEDGSDDIEEDENSMDDCKDFNFPDYPQNELPPNGTQPNAGPSGCQDLKMDGLQLPTPPQGEGRGRNRLARSLWPPGMPYHGPQPCPYCPRVLSNVGNWRKHVLTMHFAKEKVYKCHLCSSSFRTSEYLQKHYVRVHNYPQKMTRKKFAETP